MGIKLEEQVFFAIHSFDVSALLFHASMALFFVSVMYNSPSSFKIDDTTNVWNLISHLSHVIAKFQ